MISHPHMVSLKNPVSSPKSKTLSLCRASLMGPMKTSFRIAPTLATVCATSAVGDQAVEV